MSGKRQELGKLGNPGVPPRGDPRVKILPHTTSSFLVQRMGSAADFIMCADRLQQDSLSTFVLDKLEDNPKVVAGAASPGNRRVRLSTCVS